MQGREIETLVYSLCACVNFSWQLTCTQSIVGCKHLYTGEIDCLYVILSHQITLQVKHLLIFEPKTGIDTLYGFSSEWEMFSVGPYKWGFWQHIQSNCCLELNTHQAWERSSLWIKLYLWINAIYLLLQCQSSSGKIIWPELRRPRLNPGWISMLFCFFSPEEFDCTGRKRKRTLSIEGKLL